MNFLNFSQDFFRLRQFYFIAKAGSLTGAARMLNSSHAALSTSMKILEHRLKAKLFIRTARGMQLTPDGERLLEHVIKSFQESDEFFKSFLDRSEVIQGEIKVITTPAMSCILMAKYIKGFVELYPQIKIQIIGNTKKVDFTEGDVAIRPYISHYPN